MMFHYLGEVEEIIKCHLKDSLPVPLSSKVMVGDLENTPLAVS